MTDEIFTSLFAPPSRKDKDIAENRKYLRALGVVARHHKIDGELLYGSRVLPPPDYEDMFHLELARALLFQTVGDDAWVTPRAITAISAIDLGTGSRPKRRLASHSTSILRVIAERPTPAEDLARMQTVPLRYSVDAGIRPECLRNNPTFVLVTPAPPPLDRDDLRHRQLLEVRLGALLEPRPSSTANTRRPHRVVTERTTDVA